MIRRDSLADEELHQQKSREMAVGVSSPVPESSERSTSDGAAVDMGTTESGLVDKVDDLVGFG